MSIKCERIGEQRTGGDILERGNFVGEKKKQKVSSIFWVESMGESFSTVVFWRGEWQHLSFGSHHLHTWIIFGGDSEVSMLNFLYLQFIFLVFICFFSFLIIFSSLWYEYCIAWVWIIKATHDCCWLVINHLGTFWPNLGFFINRFNRFSTIAGSLYQSWGTPAFLCLVLTPPGSELRTVSFFFFLNHLGTFWLNLRFFTNRMNRLGTGSTGSAP